MIADCTTGFALAPGASRNLSLSIAPQITGALTGAAVLTDNALYATAGRQSISLAGTGSGTAPNGGPPHHGQLFQAGYCKDLERTPH